MIAVPRDQKTLKSNGIRFRINTKMYCACKQTECFLYLFFFSLSQLLQTWIVLGAVVYKDFLVCLAVVRCCILLLFVWMLISRLYWDISDFTRTFFFSHHSKRNMCKEQNEYVAAYITTLHYKPYSKTRVLTKNLRWK